MKNRELVTKALEILCDIMAPWICKNIREKIPDYKINVTLWWEKAVVPFATTFSANQNDLLLLKSWSDRMDALDMKGLLVHALRRVGDKDGEPVIQLKTAFGGGKTHSMLAILTTNLCRQYLHKFHGRIISPTWNGLKMRRYAIGTLNKHLDSLPCF